MKDTGKVSSIMIEGAIKKVKTLLEKGELDGIISLEEQAIPRSPQRL